MVKDEKFQLLQLRAFSIALGFGTALLLAHSLGAEGYGRFEAAVAWSLLASILVLGGSQRFLVREIARARETKDQASIRIWVASFGRHLLRRGVQIAGLSTAVVLAFLLSGREELAARIAIATLVFAPILVFLQKRQAVLQGFEFPVLGQVGEFLVLPGTLTLSVVVLYLTDTIDVYPVLAGYGVAAILAAAIANVLARRSCPTAFERVDEESPLDLAPLVRVFLWLEAFRILDARIDLLLLDALDRGGEAGQFAAASRLANLLAIVLLAANTVLAPKLARHHAAGEHSAMQALLTTTARATFALALPVTAAVVAFGPSILELLGDDFGPAERPLWILLGAQFFNVAAGSAGVLLQMAGEEKRVLRVLVWTSVLHLAASGVLIPRYGALGAAIATGASIVGWNLSLALSARRHCRLDSTILGLRAGPGSGLGEG